VTPDYKSLKARHRIERDAQHPNLALRLHRALSWLDRAEHSQDDQDSEFIFLWISFNAAYANEIISNERFTEREIFGHFFERICEMDPDKKLYDLVWSEFAGSVRVLLANKYVFHPFWDYCNRKITEEEWSERFTRANAAANRALGHRNTQAVLAIIFSRLYTLRNQMIHGGATWNGNVNRNQIRDSVHILRKMIPVLIEIMMNHPDEVWGDPCYPVVD
jgi:hypothetical protein